MTVLDPAPASERAYTELRERILSGDIPPNTRLVEIELARDLGLSRTPIREALKRLTEDGILAMGETRSLVVRAPTASEIDEIYAVRHSLDGLAARLCARLASEGGVARLEAVMGSMRKAVEGGEMKAIVRVNVLFHDVIYHLAGNDVLRSISDELRSFVRRFSSEAHIRTGRARVMLAEHEEIFAAIAAHDPEAAADASDRHVQGARRHISRLYLEELLAPRGR